MSAFSVHAESVEEEETLTVDKMIHLTFETHDKNIVNFKLLQSILHILAHRMKILEQDVDIRLEERHDIISALKEKLRDIDISSMSESDDERSTSGTTEKVLAVDNLTGSDEVKGRRDAKDKKGGIKAGKQTGTTTLDKSGKGKGKTTRKKAGTRDVSTSDESDVDGGKRKNKSTSKKGDKRKKGTTDGYASSSEDTEDNKSVKGKRGKQSKKEADSISTDGRTSKDKKGKISKKGDTADSAERGSDDKKIRKKKGETADVDDDHIEDGTKKGKKADDDTGEKIAKMKKGKVGGEDDVGEDDQRRKGKLDENDEDGLGKRGRTKKGEELDEVGIGGKGKRKKGDEAKGGPKHKTEEGTFLDTLRKKAPGHKDTVGRGTMTRGSIELVTRSQFDLLKGEVGKLRKKNEPFPLPSMPDNLMIKEALSKGTTTLTGAMEAMQLNARVRAAEQALTRIADLLTTLAAAGAFPESMTALIDQLFKDKEELAHLMEEGEKVLKAKGVKGSKSAGSNSVQSGVSLRLGKSKVRHAGMPSTATMVSSVELPPPDPLVTNSGLSEAIENMMYEMMKNMVQMTDKSTAASEQAVSLVKTVEKKMVTALAVNGRITELDAITAKHTQKLNGFDAGLTAQLENFQKQMKEMKTKLTGGLEQMALDNKLESLMVASLKESQEKMELKVDQASHNMHSLLVVLKRLNSEAKSVKESVKMVGSEKVNREDLLKSLEEKVDLNRLHGLLKDEAFEVCRRDLDQKLDICFEEFTKTDNYWIDVLKEKKKEISSKAKLLDLYILKDFTTGYLNDMRDMLERLELAMGDPQVAKLMRDLSRTAYCASCMIAALMDPFDITYGKPPALPALTRDYFGKEYEKESSSMHLRDERVHISKRWVGGSHTIMSQRTTPRSPHTQVQETPTRRYTAIAEDGHIYMMEEELPPCPQCKDFDKSFKEPFHRKSREVGGEDPRLNQEEYNQEQASNMSIAGSSIFNLN